MREKLIQWCLCAGLVCAVWVAYANHFENGFHFDDFHTVTENPAIRELRNVPRFFTDTSLFSTMLDHQTYRPLVSASLAVDYWLAKGLKPFYFQLSTFLWYLVLLVLAFCLFRRVMDCALPSETNVWTAALAAACYGLHPVNAETVNYVIQRADLYGTLGIVASLLWFSASKTARRTGIYLLPAVAAYLSKAPALIFPLILLLYMRWVEDMEWSWRNLLAPAIVTAAAIALTLRMTPPAYDPGATSPALYRLTQPWIALHYFKSFFLPTELSADSDWGYVPGALSTQAFAGYLFVALLVAAAIAAARKREARPIAFGIAWFLLALLPTSLMPLAEVTNDHRMFFPFVGLSLAVVWSLRLWVFGHPARLRAAAAAFVVVLCVEGWGVHERNQVWRTEESLWRDVTEKSPHNGRGWMNYGLTFMSRGDFDTALSDFRQAALYSRNYWALEINLAIATGKLNGAAEARQHFERAIALAPRMADPYFYYGRWLSEQGNPVEAIVQLQKALELNPGLQAARQILDRAKADQRKQPAPGQALSGPTMPPEALLDLSLSQYQAGRYKDCISSAKQALQLRPGYAEAYNNLAAAYNALHRWDEGIAAARQALRLRPGYELAQNNLNWALAQKQKGAESVR